MTLALIDGYYFIHRTINAGVYDLSFEGTPTGVVFGVLKTVRSALSKVNPTKAIFVLEGGMSASRVSLFPEYKANRKKERTPEEEAKRALFRHQRDLLIDVLPTFGISTFRLPGREGDDVIGALSVLYEGKVAVVTDDKDLLQLVSDRVSVYRPMKDQYVTSKDFKELVGIPARNFLTYLAILGDKSDNIPGVKGVGEKTAKALLESFDGTVGDLASLCAESASARVRKVADQRTVIDRNLKLMDLNEELQGLSNDEATALVEALEVRSTCDKSEARRAAVNLGFRSMLEAFSSWIRPFERLN